MGHLHRGKLLQMAKAREAALAAGATREEAKAAAHACMVPAVSGASSAPQGKRVRRRARKVKGERRASKKAA